MKIFACSDSFWPAADLLIGLPLVAVAMAVQTAFVDAVLFRIQLKKTAKRRLGLLLVANTLNATVAFANGYAWVIHHRPNVVAIADKWH